MRDKDLLKTLQKDGWEMVSIKGSHHKLKKGNKKIVLPVHGKDIPKGTLHQIMKNVGLK